MEHPATTVVQFELRLSAALRRAGATALPAHMPSRYLIPLEYEILQALACAGCGRTGLQKLMQSALPARDAEHRSRWTGSAIAGDRLSCRCPGCGQPAEIYFWFVDGDLGGFAAAAPE